MNHPVAVSLFAILCSATSGAKPRRHLAPAPYLSTTAKALLAERMDKHGAQIELLTEAIVLFSYDTACEVGDEIADRPLIARPKPGETDTLNASLPSRFFDLQEELRLHATEVAKAAAAKDDARLGAAFARLTATCVACHSLYIRGDLEKERRAFQPPD